MMMTILFSIYNEKLINFLRKNNEKEINEMHRRPAKTLPLLKSI